MAILDFYIATILKEKDFFDKNPSAGRHAVSDDQQIPISISFTGDIGTIEAAGFHSNGIFGTVSFGSADIRAIRLLAEHPQVEKIEGPRRDVLMLNNSVPDIGANQVWTHTGNDFTGYTGAGVIVGIIDTGINITHPVFQAPNGPSRILSIWDQTLKLEAGESSPKPINNTNVSSGPMTISYGVEYLQAQITSSIQSPAHSTVKHKDDDGHGTHVAGIAAGNGSVGTDCTLPFKYVGVAPDADLIIVRQWGLTPADITANPAGPLGAGKSNYLIDAISYIVNIAKPQVSSPPNVTKPLVINISSGVISNLMDGSDHRSTVIDYLLNLNKGLGIVFSAGNYGKIKCHARVTIPALAAGSPPTPGMLDPDLEFYLFPLDTRTRYISIVNPAKLLYTIKTPHPKDNPITASTADNTPIEGNATVTMLTYGNATVLKISPPAGGYVPTGTWVIHLENSTAADAIVDVYLDGANPNETTSPIFVDSTYCTSLSTLSETAAGKNSISVGCYEIGDDASHTLSDFSSRGPTTDNRRKPDLCAPGVNIKSAGHAASTSACCCACCQTNYIAKQGTSQAAPHVTGTIALMLHKNPGLTYSDIKDYLTGNADPIDPGATTTDIDGWGAGRVDAKKAVDAVPQVNPPKTTPFTAVDPEYAASLQEQFLETPNGKDLAGLFERYFPELLGLVNHNKRVATGWHRSKGPVWARLAMQAFYTPGMRIGTELDGLSLRESVARFLDVLKEYASGAFLREFRPFEPLVASLTGEMTIPEMIILVGNFQYDTDTCLQQPVH